MPAAAGDRSTARSSTARTGLSLDGETVYRGTATGALAERVVVDERVALPTGGGVPLEQAALLGCAALTGVGAVLFAARVVPGASVLVVGAGGVGQFVIQGARIAGAASIIVVDPLPERRAQALTSGATHAVGAAELEAAIRDLGLPGVDYAFDAVGDPATTALALAPDAERRHRRDRRPACCRRSASTSTLPS